MEPNPDRVYGRTRGTHVGKERGDRYRPLGPEAPLHESALMCCSFRFFVVPVIIGGGHVIGRSPSHSNSSAMAFSQASIFFVHSTLATISPSGKARQELSPKLSKHINVKISRGG